MVAQIKQAKDEILKVRVTATTWAQLKARAEHDGKPVSTTGRELIEDALGDNRRKPRSIKGQPVVAANDAVLIQIDALNDLLDLIAGRNGSQEAVILAMHTATAFGRWAEHKAADIGTTTEAIYRESIRS